MTFLPSLLSSPPYLDLPRDLAGQLTAGIGWLVFLGIILYLLRRWRGMNRESNRRDRILFLILAALVPPTSLFIGLRLPAASSALSPQGLPVEPLGPAIMVFAAFPWVFAAGLLGPAPAAVLGAFSGLLLALWETHSPFTILEMSLLAVLFGAAVHQPYRTLAFRLLRHPIVAALLLSVLYPFIFLITTSLSSSGVLTNRLDYALTHLSMASLAIAAELLLAGLFAEAAAISISSWGYHGPGVPSPAERSLQARFLFGVAPIAFLLFILLMAGDWIVSSRAARRMLEERMANAAELASENIPYFLEAGQNLISTLSVDPRLRSDKPAELQEALQADLRSVPYFRQLFLLDDTGQVITGYPDDDYAGLQAPPDEQVGVQMALTGGAPFQYFTILPESGGRAAQVSFVTPVFTQNKEIRGVLVGRADLASNPFTQPILKSLDNIAGSGGQGLLLDEEGRILYGANSSALMGQYTGNIPEAASFFDEAAPDGTRRLVYYQPAAGRPWAVILSIPAQRAQGMALSIALPLLGMVLLLAAFSIVLLHFGLKVVTGSLQTLSVEATNIAHGQLDHPLPVDGEDEVGQLRLAFEQMRLSLKARLDELNRLLLVSQGVASSLEITDAVSPVLEAALSLSGASAARVVLSKTAVPALGPDDEFSSFGHGPASDIYAGLDDGILELARQKERVALTNLSRQRTLKIPAGMPYPQSLYALALRHENLYFGALWVAFDDAHLFTEEEVRFLATLAGQAALAAANARLFATAEIGRQRLAAILASTPDPVLVTDQQNRLLLANPAAWRVLGLGIELDEGQLIDQVISQEKLLELLRSPIDDKPPVEVALPDGRVYYATASTVQADGQRVGRVCVLRDVTYFKELDAMKSEFVATVSHDLRSPLTLMRGYATMLEMVGELNEQQVAYVHKIVGGVENMSRLVSNLLDLGRIEAGIDLQLDMVQVQDIVERVVNGLQLQATQKRITISLDSSQVSTPVLEADSALLHQALYNLVENAIKYTETGGQVGVRIETRGERTVFAVSDTGIGIAPVDQARLFEKFYRGAQGGKGQRGTGLGLAIVKSIAERHGGQVWMESQLGKGSTFYFAIPIRQQVAVKT